MRSRRWRGGVPVAGIVVLILMIAGFVAQQLITTHAFDRLEADQIAQDAQRVRIGLESHVRLLANYGATNSIWDNSYTDVRSGDRAAFLSDFPPDQVRGIFGLDGVLGVATDGTLRTGGLVDGTQFVPPPPGLVTAPELARLFDPRAPAGASRCGLVVTSAAPFLYCGFAAHKSDGGAAVGGGLIYLSSLGRTGLAQLGDQLTLPLTLVTTPRPGLVSEPGISSSLGTLAVSTGTVSGDLVALDVTAPAAGGRTVRLETLRPRPIHAQALAVAHDLMALMALLGSVLFAAVILITRRELHQRVGPLRRTAEDVIRSGDRSLRIGGAADGDLGALARAIDGMLDAMATQDEELEHARLAREAQLRSTYVQQRLAAQHVGRRAQAAIDETAGAVVAELQDVVREVEAMESAVSSIDAGVQATESLTRSVADRALAGGRTATAVAESLQRVSGIAQMIAGVAAQTNLLSLNATIEAARAGEAGKGFAVVAGEVKQLANSTTRSTDEIAATLDHLEQDVSAMAEVITEMTEGVSGIGGQAARLSEVARRQRTQMEALDAAMREVMGRIAAMSSVSDAIERREHERVRADGVVEIRCAGGTVTAALLDLSEGGLRCLVDAGPVPALDQPVTVALSVDGATETFEATVVRAPTGDQAAAGDREVAVEFRDASPQGLLLVRRYVESLIGAQL